MTCRHLGTSPNDGNFEPPRKRALGTLLIALALALSVVAVVAAVSITPPLVGEALAFGDDGGGGEGGGEDGGSGDGDGGSSSSNDPPPGFKPKLKLVPWLSGDWSRDGAGERALRDLLTQIRKVQLRLPAQRRMELTPFELRQFELWQFSLMVFDLRMFELWQSDRPFGNLTFSRSQLKILGDVLTNRDRPTLKTGFFQFFRGEPFEMKATTDIRRPGALTPSERQLKLLELSKEQRARLRERERAWDDMRDGLTHSSIPSPSALSRTAPQQARQQPATAESLRDQVASTQRAQDLRSSALNSLRIGQYNTALDTLREALALQPGNPVLRADVEYLEYAKWYSQQSQPFGTSDRFARSNAADLILDALEAGKGNLIGSIAYLEDQMLKHEGNATYALSALGYLEGLYQSYLSMGDAAAKAQKRREERERAKALAASRARLARESEKERAVRLAKEKSLPGLAEGTSLFRADGSVKWDLAVAGNVPEKKTVLDTLTELFMETLTPVILAPAEAMVALSDPSKKGLHSPRPPIQTSLVYRWEERTQPLLMESRINRSRAVAEARRQTKNPVEAMRYLEEQAAETRAIQGSYYSHNAAQAVSYLQGLATYYDLHKDATRDK